MITADQIARFQALQQGTMTSSCQVVRRSRSSDGAGGSTMSEQTFGPYPCRVSPGGSNESIVAGRQIGVGTWRISLPAGTDVKISDRLVVNTVSYEVLSILAPETVETARVCVCQGVQGA